MQFAGERKTHTLHFSQTVYRLRDCNFLILIICLCPDTKSTVWTHTLCRKQVDKNRQNRR